MDTREAVALGSSIVSRRVALARPSNWVRGIERGKHVGQTHRAWPECQPVDEAIEHAYGRADRWVRKELDSDGDSTTDHRQVLAYDI